MSAQPTDLEVQNSAPSEVANQNTSAPVVHASNTEFLLTENNPLSYDQPAQGKSFDVGDILTKGVPLSVASGAYSIYNSTLGLISGQQDLSKDLQSYDSAWASYYDDNKTAIDLAGNIEGLLIPGSGALKVLNLAKDAKTTLGSMAFVRTLGNIDRAAAAWKTEAVAAGVNQAAADTLISASWKQKIAIGASALQDSLVLNTFAYATMNKSQMYDDYTLGKFTSDTLFGGLLMGIPGLIKGVREVSTGINEAQSALTAASYIKGNYAGTPTWAKMHGLLADAEVAADPKIAGQAKNAFLGMAKDLVPPGQENLQRNLQPFLQGMDSGTFLQDFAGANKISIATPVETDISTGAGLKNFLLSNNVLTPVGNSVKGVKSTAQEVFHITSADAGNLKKMDVAGQSVFTSQADAETALSNLPNAAQYKVQPISVLQKHLYNANINANIASDLNSNIYTRVGDLPTKGLAVANIGNDGKVYVGKPNGLHFQVAEQHSNTAGGFKDLGFVTPEGKYLNREQALDWVNSNEGKVKPSENMQKSLDALDYREQIPVGNRIGGQTNSRLLYAPNTKSFENSNIMGLGAGNLAQAIKEGKIPAATPYYYVNLLTKNRVEDIVQTAGDKGIHLSDPKNFYLDKQAHNYDKFEGFFDEPDPAVSDGMFLLGLKQAESPGTYFKVTDGQKANFLTNSAKGTVAPKWAVSDTNLLGLQGIYAQAAAKGETVIPIIEGGPSGVIKYKSTDQVADIIRGLKSDMFEAGQKQGLTLDDLSVRLNMNAQKWVLGDKSEFALYRDASQAEAYASPINVKVDLDTGGLPTREDYLASLDRKAIQEAQRLQVISIQSPVMDDLIPHDIFIDGYQAKDFTPRTGLAGTFTFGGNSKVGTAASYMERVGAMVQEATLKYKTANQQGLLPSVTALQSNPNALFEFNSLVNLARSLPTGYSVVPEVRTIGGRQLTFGKIQNRATGQFIKNQSSNNNYKYDLRADPNAQTDLDLLISPTVMKFHQDFDSIKNDFITRHNAIAEAAGNNLRIDPQDLYYPPVDVRNRDFFAFVKGKDGQVSSITAGSASDLKAQAEAIKQQFGDSVDVIYKDDIKSYKKRFGDFDSDQFFRSYGLDSAIRRSGRLSTLAPSTNDTTLNEILSFMDKSADNVIRGATSNYMAKEFEELHFLGQQYSEASASKRGPLASLSFKADNPYQDYINTALNKSKLSSVPVLESLNNSLNLTISKAFDEIKTATDFTSDKPLQVDQGIKQIADRYGIKFDYSQPELVKTINATYTKDAASGIVSRFNGIMTKLTLSLDAMFHATNLISGAMMQAPEMANLARNIKNGELAKNISGLTTVNIPGSDVQFPSMMKIMSKSVMKLLDKNDTSLQGYIERGLVQSDVLKYRDTQAELTDLMARPPVTLPGKGLKAVNDGINKAANFADKWATNPIEKFLQFMAVDAAHQYTEAAGVSDMALRDVVANQFARRVTGNYISGQRPVIFQGPLGHALGLFQTFMFAVGQNLTRYVADGDKAALTTFGLMQAGLFGAQSNPVFQALNYHIGQQNANRKDLFTGAYSYGKVADWLLYGIPSNALNLSLYTRGDLTPINPTILPTSLSDVPIVSAALKLGGVIANTTKIVTQGGGDGDTFLRAIAQNGLNRPLAGMAQLADGRSTFNSGETINSSIRDWTAWTRVVGGRPFDEQKMLDGYYRQKYYEAYDIKQLKTLGTAIKSKVAAGVDPSDDDVKNFLNNYMQAGGNARNFQRYWTQQVVTARTDLGDRMYLKMANSPKFDEYRSVLGATNIRDPNGSYFGEQKITQDVQGLDPSSPLSPPQ